MTSMSFAEMERVLTGKRKQMVRAMEMLDDALALIGHVKKPNGHAPTIHAAVKAKKAKKHDKRVLQGRYMGLIRTLTTAQKAEVKKAKEEHGFHEAFKTAKAFLADKKN